MPFVDTSRLKVVQRLPGWFGRYFHSTNMTFAHYDFKRGASIHEHFHSQEEVYEVIDGELELTIDGATQIVRFGLVAVVRICSRTQAAMTPFAVAAFITAAYWFTSSTSFANPAVTLARSVSDTFAGIRPTDAPGFIAAQTVGAVSATMLCRWLLARAPAVTDRALAGDEENAA